MKKLLLIKISSLGDVIFNTPLANLLKKNGYQVDWIVGEKGIDIVKNNPCVNKTYLIPFQKWKKEGFGKEQFKELVSIIKEIRAEKYDVAIDCQQRFKSLPILMFCGAKRRITDWRAKEGSIFAANEIMTKVSDNCGKVHVTRIYMDFSKHLGIDDETLEFSLPPSTVETKAKIDELLKDVDKSKPLVVISPATTWVTKHWERAHWRTLIDAIKDKCSLVFTGTQKENELLVDLGADKFTNLAGKTSVKDLIELYSRANIMLGPDSGSTHLARATNKPAVICISTSTPPSLYGPTGDPEKYFAVGNSNKLKCQYCHRSKCGREKDKNICTQYPKPDEIINIVNKLLLKGALIR